MTRHRIELALVALTTAASFACACSKDARPPAALGGEQAVDHTPVATLNGQPITMGELDAEVAGQLRDMEDQRYQIRHQGLEQLITRRLFQAAAKRENIDEKAWTAANIDSKLQPVSAEQVKQFFDERQGQLPSGAKLEDYRDRIVNYLEQQSRFERRRTVIADLRKDAKVDILLKAPAKPRVQVAAIGPSRGPADAKVTIVEFSDFECPYCRQGHGYVEQVMKKYEGKVRLVFRHFPLLTMHPHAKKAAEASMCADAQGKFWEMHDALFDAAGQNQLELPQIKALASKLSLDKVAFDKCLDSGEQAKKVEADLADAEKAGVNGVPAFFINGVELSGAGKVERFSEIIDQELAAK